MFWSRLGLAFSWIAAILVALTLFGGVKADCECGYSIYKGTENYTVFTEVLETDFTRQRDWGYDYDWIAQNWTVNGDKSIEDIRKDGIYGWESNPKNFINNPIMKGTTKGANGTDPGVQLWVNPPNDLRPTIVRGAEIVSNRTDMIHGSFRSAMKLTSVNGTCGAFFWYLNDTQEIDLEFLKARDSNGFRGYPINIVLHSSESNAQGNDASRTGGYETVVLPFDPTNAVHEYRFDWSPDWVKVYADGKLLKSLTDKKYIPTNPGKVHFSHWSNGNKGWSTGPPTEDAMMLVQYFKGYFNTTTPKRMEDYNNRCKDSTLPMAVCPIPDQVGPPKFDETYFFYKDPAGNKVINQSMSAIESAGLSFMAHSKVASVILSSLLWTATRLLL